MTELASKIMRLVHGIDIWENFNRAPDYSFVPGWNGNHIQLITHNPVLAIDVGVYLGQSTITIAKHMKKHGVDGCVIAVDTFLGSPEIMGHIRQRWHGRPLMYENFLANIKYHQVEDYVVPLPMTSSGAAQILERQRVYPDFVHIDAAHDYVSVLQDCEAYWKILAPGGTMIGDDYDWPDVKKAAREFALKVEQPLEVDTIKWILKKPAADVSPLQSSPPA